VSHSIEKNEKKKQIKKIKKKSIYDEIATKYHKTKRRDQTQKNETKTLIVFNINN